MPHLRDATTGEVITMTSLRVTRSGRMVRVLSVSPFDVQVEPAGLDGLPLGPAYRTGPEDIGAMIVP